jgi:hypothetical protein
VKLGRRETAVIAVLVFGLFILLLGLTARRSPGPASPPETGNPTAPAQAAVSGALPPSPALDPGAGQRAPTSQDLRRDMDPVIEGQLQTVVQDNMPKVGDRDFIYPDYAGHVPADGGATKKFIEKVLKNFEGVEEIRFSMDVWNSLPESPGTKPDVTNVLVTVRGNDLVFEKDGEPLLKYIGGTRMLYAPGNPTPVHLDKTEEAAALKIQAMLQRFPWDGMKTVSVRQDDGKGGVVEKPFVEAACQLNEARALIDPETMELRRLEYVQEARGGGVAYQRLSIQTEYLDYVNITISPDRTFRFPSRVRGIFNNTKQQQVAFRDFAVKMKTPVED